MVSVHKIKGRDILDDIHSGMSNDDLMEKYEMSAQALQSAFDQLLSSGLITSKAVQIRSLPNTATESTTVTTRLPRDYLVIQVPIYETKKNTQGIVRDLTEETVGIIGIESRLDDVKSFVIQIDGSSDKILFQARCRWVKQDSNGEHLCGFRIISITRENLGRLRNLIQELNWGS
jgi:hypothetical protein